MHVRDEPLILALGPVEDTLSRQSGNNDGVSHCGPRRFRFVHPETVPPFVVLDGDSLRIAPKA